MGRRCFIFIEIEYLQGLCMCDSVLCNRTNEGRISRPGAGCVGKSDIIRGTTDKSFSFLLWLQRDIKPFH